MQSKRAGTCTHCHGAFAQGDEIEWFPGRGARHWACRDEVTGLRSPLQITIAADGRIIGPAVRSRAEAQKHADEIRSLLPWQRNDQVPC